MESIFGLIVFALIFIVGAAEKAGKKKKSDAITNAERPMPSKADALRRQASEAVKAVSAEAMKSLKEEIGFGVPEAAPAAKPAASNDKPAEQLSLIEAFMQKQAAKNEAHGSIPMGDSVTDADGCIGGSLGEHREEGESRAEHAEHVARRDAALAAEHSIAAEAAKLRNANRDELRRAVVMAEILGKPKALRH